MNCRIQNGTLNVSMITMICICVVHLPSLQVQHTISICENLKLHFKNNCIRKSIKIYCSTVLLKRRGSTERSWCINARRGQIPLLQCRHLLVVRLGVEVVVLLEELKFPGSRRHHMPSRQEQSLVYFWEGITQQGMDKQGHGVGMKFRFGACIVLVEGTATDLLLTKTLCSSELTKCVEESGRDTTLFGSLTWGNSPSFYTNIISLPVYFKAELLIRWRTRISKEKKKSRKTKLWCILPHPAPWWTK